MQTVDTSADENPNPTTSIATQARAVLKAAGDDQVGEHQHHQEEGGQVGREEGRSGTFQSPEVGRKAKPWIAKRRRRGVVKDGLV